MTNKKKLIACALICAMTIGVTACDDSEAVPSGSNAPMASSSTTHASTTTDPNENAATDQEIKILDTSRHRLRTETQAQ